MCRQGNLRNKARQKASFAKRESWGYGPMERRGNRPRLGQRSIEEFGRESVKSSEKRCTAQSACFSQELSGEPQRFIGSEYLDGEINEHAYFLIDVPTFAMHNVNRHRGEFMLGQNDP